MINKRITLLGPEGTNIYVFLQYLVFCVISWFTLFDITNEIGLDIQNVLVRQIIFTILGMIIFFLFTYVSVNNIFSLANVLIFSSTVLLVGVLFTQETLGARRRYDLGVFDFQPSEFTKVAFIIFLARAISQKSNKLLTFTIITLNIALIYLQPDLGTTFILLSIVIAMYFLSNVSVKSVITAFILLFISFFILLEFELVSSFQVQRITDFYSSDIQDFSQRQSRLQISLGGILGEDLSNTQNISIFVPVQTTDFIFSSFAKSFGFIGCITLIFLWIFFGFRVYKLVLSSNSEFEKFLLSGFVILLYLQIVINVATVLGLIPLTGDPFPLLSLGGSSIIAVSSIFGIINRVFIENNQII